MIPAEFAGLELKYFRRISRNEFSSACPKCGGEQHQSGEFPDRFRLWIKSKATGKPMGWCRRCGYIWMQGNLSPEENTRWVAEQRVYEEERRTEMQLAVEVLRKDRAWIHYNELLDGTFREFYYLRGLTDFWIDYWMLGYNPEKSVWDNRKGEFYNTPSLTIPVFAPAETEPFTIRNRLLSPRDPNDKYRPEFKNLPTGLFLTDRENKPSGKVILVEGEFKAMTTYVTLDSIDYFVVGSPGKRPSPQLFEILDECEVVYLLLDPDAFERETANGVTAVRKMIDFFKDRARVIRLPYKVDDMILSGQLAKSSLLSLIRNARKIKRS